MNRTSGVLTPEMVGESTRPLASPESVPGPQPAKSKEPSAGYRDRPWIPRFWDGMNLAGWLHLLWRNRFRITPRRWPMATIITFCTALNTVLAIAQRALRGKRIAETPLGDDPIFIIGHWRSGTTLLHELLVQDPRHSFPSTYACFAPNHFVLTGRVLPPILNVIMPMRRPMDNMPVGWDHPQEDEFALCNMGLPSPYLSMAFPNQPPHDREYLTLDGVPPADLARWKERLFWFLKCVTVTRPGRIVLKSPPHTGRVRVLLELFPKARFVHICRDPVVLFASTVNLWKRLYRDQGLQTPHYRDLEQRVFDDLVQMYEAFERDRGLIPSGQLCEVRYETLVADPLGEIRRVYEELRLGDFEPARPGIEKYLAAQAGYKRNRYDIPPSLKREIASRWAFYFQRYGYPLPED